MKTETAKRLVDEAIRETDNAIYLPMELRVRSQGHGTASCKQTEREYDEQPRQTLLEIGGDHS